jgi:hypothetical protein
VIEPESDKEFAVKANEEAAPPVPAPAATSVHSTSAAGASLSGSSVMTLLCADSARCAAGAAAPAADGNPPLLPVHL